MVSINLRSDKIIEQQNSLNFHAGLKR